MMRTNIITGWNIIVEWNIMMGRNIKMAKGISTASERYWLKFDIFLIS
jgi:hypothetical protein